MYDVRLLLHRAAAHATGGLLSVEPYCAAEAPPSSATLAGLLELCDVFSCTDVEAVSMVWSGTPLQLADRY